MIGEYNILTTLAEYPWLAVGLMLLMLGFLLLPYDLIDDRRDGIRQREIHAILWSWKEQPDYSRLHLSGLRLLQRALLESLHMIWKLARVRFVGGISDMLRRWLG